MCTRRWISFDSAGRDVRRTGQGEGGKREERIGEKGEGVGKGGKGGNWVGTLDRGTTIYDGLAGTYLGQRLLSVARGPSPTLTFPGHGALRNQR